MSKIVRPIQFDQPRKLANTLKARAARRRREQKKNRMRWFMLRLCDPIGMYYWAWDRRPATQCEADNDNDRRR